MLRQRPLYYGAYFGRTKSREFIRKYTSQWWSFWSCFRSLAGDRFHATEVHVDMRRKGIQKKAHSRWETERQNTEMPWVLHLCETTDTVRIDTTEKTVVEVAEILYNLMSVESQREHRKSLHRELWRFVPIQLKKCKKINLTSLFFWRFIGFASFNTQE